MRAAVCILLALRACAAAVSIRLDAPGSALYVTSKGSEKKIADAAFKAWPIDEGREVLYSAADGAGGYEGEGQALHVYDIAAGSQRKILSEYFVITTVEEVKTKSGQTALLIRMRDGGLGASHFAVADPTRGEVFSAGGADIAGRRGDIVTLGYYNDEDWEKLRAKVKVSPYKTERYDLNEILRRPVLENKASP